MSPSPTAKSPNPTTSSATARGVVINAETGLCTDYLNHFNEAIMVLEMLSAVPEVLEEFVDWQPRSYREHFVASNFKNREAVLAAYQAADPTIRDALDALAGTMNEVLSAAKDMIKGGNSASTAGAFALDAARRLKALVAQTGMVINGRMTDRLSNSEASATQEAVDALLRR